MGATFNTTTAGGAVSTAITEGLPSGQIGFAQLFAGARPGDPTITSGITALSANRSLPPGTWLASSNGVSALANSIGFTATASGTVSFIRFYFYGNQAVAILDVDVGLVSSGAKAIVSTLTAVSGQTVNLTDMRFRVAAFGDTCVSPSVANEIVNIWSHNEAVTVSNSYSNLAAFSKRNVVSGVYDRPVTVEAWDGIIPANSSATPTGVKLWSKAITSNDLFAVSGLSASIISNQTANAIASGTPTFIRVTKAAYDVIPATSLQAPVSAQNGALFANTTMVSGQSNTLTNLTLSFQA
jgi:hypothetical protein